jgi:protein-tyrosine phosphatase
LIVAGKGRSGTIAVSYLVTYENWPSGKALKHFTTQRMRFGEGVSIPSQRRWVRYVELWARKLGNQYTQGIVEVTKIQFWGMKIGDGGDKVEVGIAGFVEGQHPGAKTVNKIHVFQDSEVSYCSRWEGLMAACNGWGGVDLYSDDQDPDHE